MIRWPRHPLVYEMNARLLAREAGAASGGPPGLAAVPEPELEAIAHWGFDAVWLMGVWTVGADGVRIARSEPGLREAYARALPDWTEADVIGSPYAVARYEVAPELGGPEGLAAFRERLARHGVGLLLDFVPNHTARDHPLLQEAPEAYMPGSEEDRLREPGGFFRAPGGAVVAHGRDPHFAPWTDTAQLDPTRPAGRGFLERTLFEIAEQCDGVRCDMAMLLLPEVFERTWGARLAGERVRESFWAEVIPRLLARRPDFLLLAESYWGLEWTLQQEGFHFTYDKTLYDRLRAGDAEGVRTHLSAELAYQRRCARFIENHDEERAAAVLGRERLRSAAVASFCVPGLRLFHEGQLEGRRVRLPVQLGRRPPELADAAVAELHETLLELVREPILKDGHFRQLGLDPAGPGDATHRNLLALSWTPGAKSPRRGFLGFLVIVNLTGERAYARLPLAAPFEPGGCYELIDRSDGVRYARKGEELTGLGLYVALDGHAAHLFEVTGK